MAARGCRDGDEQWLTPRLHIAATLCNQTPAATES
ncbi:hypothetical protein QU863_12460, partial [Escherichia coli]|nr:hypothetical protein [Escherichia coli]